MVLHFRLNILTNGEPVSNARLFYAVIMVDKADEVKHYIKKKEIELCLTNLILRLLLEKLAARTLYLCLKIHFTGLGCQ